MSTRERELHVGSKYRQPEPGETSCRGWCKRVRMAVSIGSAPLLGIYISSVLTTKSTSQHCFPSSRRTPTLGVMSGHFQN